MHKPVLLKEVLQVLVNKTNGVYVDATFGFGGYSEAILNNCQDLKLIAFDRDENVLDRAKVFSEKYSERFQFFNNEFSDIAEILKHNGVSSIDGIVYDIGVSSMQIDDAKRGFSFQKSGPLDMRMNQRQNLDAKQVVNEYLEEDIANIIYKYGDERKSRRIAKAIVSYRQNKEILDTLTLARVIEDAVGYYNDKIHPATRTFQALRIYLNDELNQIETSLENIKPLVSSGGRVAVVTFHSGEDKIVKSIFNEWCGKNKTYSRYEPIMEEDQPLVDFKFVKKGTIVAGKDELNQNVRARSAKLRCVERLRP